MQATRRKCVNAIDAASLARWIILTGFVGIAGLIYVYLSLQLSHLGDRKKALETEFSALQLQNVDARGQIAALTSRPALQRRLKEGSLKMIAIAEHDIVRLNPPARRPGEDGIQPVANERAGR